MILFLILIILCMIYLHFTKTFTYWEERAVKYVRPVLFFGTYAKNFLVQKSVTELSVESYRRFPNEKVLGGFRASCPELIIRDPDLVKRILVTDFAHFYPRGLNPHKTVIEPLMRNLFFADGDLWRLLRQRMTPAFTSGKLKAMFPLIVERAERLQTRVLAAATAGRPLDAKDLMARYTTDFIGTVGFGLDVDSLNDENSAFQKLGVEIFNSGPLNSLVAALKAIFPKIFKSFKYLGRVEKDLTDLVQKIMILRNYEPSRRNDFIDLLIECKKKGLIHCQSLEKFNGDGTPEQVLLEFTDELIAAQVFVFFGAGFETSSSSTSFTLHQLAYHQKVQKRVQEDIARVLSKHGNKLSYDAIKEMTYLEWAFKESLRMFPPLGYLIRQSTKRYTFPELNLTIDKGVRLIIPLQALQNDPQYFENPNEFRPDRFQPGTFSQAAKQVYMPFGEGPRACIGSRLALMQSLAGLAAILSKFTVEPAPSTLRHPVVDPKANIVQSLKGGLPLLFRARTDVTTIVH